MEFGGWGAGRAAEPPRAPAYPRSQPAAPRGSITEGSALPPYSPSRGNTRLLFVSPLCSKYQESAEFQLGVDLLDGCSVSEGLQRAALLGGPPEHTPALTSLEGPGRGRRRRYPGTASLLANTGATFFWQLPRPSSTWLRALPSCSEDACPLSLSDPAKGGRNADLTF